MKGEMVTVKIPEVIGRDDLNNPIVKPKKIVVENVLVCPGATTDVTGSVRDGVEVKYTLHFPKTFEANLSHCSVVVRGETLDVIGDPKPYTAENCPTSWHLPVEVGVIDG